MTADTAYLFTSDKSTLESGAVMAALVQRQCPAETVDYKVDSIDRIAKFSSMFDGLTVKHMDAPWHIPSATERGEMPPH